MEIINSNFRMPPFVRIQWASKAIKDKYEPMFEKAKKLYWTIEKETVFRGLRPLTTEHIYPENYLNMVHDYLKRGTLFMPIKKVGVYNGTSSYHPPVEDGKPWYYYGVLTRDIEKGFEFIEASQEEKSDHYKLGLLLDYPDCCVSIFRKQFPQGVVDGIWHAASRTDEKYIKRKEETLIELKDIDWRMNIILRAYLIGVLFHTPCSFSCKKTQEKAKLWFDVAHEIDAEGLKEAELFLRLPYEWSCYKGIAYLKSPLFRISYNSNFSTKKYTVRIDGTYYPMEAPKGLEFPFDTQTAFETYLRNKNRLEYGLEV